MAKNTKVASPVRFVVDYESLDRARTNGMMYAFQVAGKVLIISGAIWLCAPIVFRLSRWFKEE